MDKKKIGALALLVLVLGVPAVLAAAEYTQTIVHFNVPSTIAYTLTLYGESADTSGSSPGTSTTDIKFDCADFGSQDSVNATVVGGSQQDDSNPIFQFDNTGTTDLDIGVYLNDSLPACIALYGNNSFQSTYATIIAGAEIDVTNVTVASSFGPGDAAVDWYMWANFSGCSASDDVDRILSSTGYT